jgi:hypothetical protein
LQVFVRNRRQEEVVAPQSTEYFLKSFGKGSKPYRRILQYNSLRSQNILTLNTVKTFCELINVIKPSADILKSCWGEWNSRFLPNRCREFLFKFRNNILGVNARVCKFVPDIEGSCVLCKEGKEPAPLNSESFLHLFFECSYSGKYRDKVVNTFFPEMRNVDTVTQKKFWFFGLLPGMEKKNLFISTLVNMINFLIWNMKLRKELVPLGSFIEDINLEAYNLIKRSAKIREEKTNANFWVCRYTFTPP